MTFVEVFYACVDLNERQYIIRKSAAVPFDTKTATRVDSRETKMTPEQKPNQVKKSVTPVHVGKVVEAGHPVPFGITPVADSRWCDPRLWIGLTIVATGLSSFFLIRLV